MHNPVSHISLPSIKFLMGHPVILIREFPQFGLCKVRYVNEFDDFVIDSELLLEKATSEHTISISLLGGHIVDT